MLDGKIVKLSDEEKQAIADEQNASVIEAAKAKVVKDRENLIQQRMDKIVRDQAIVELKAEGIL